MPDCAVILAIIYTCKLVGQVKANSKLFEVHHMNKGDVQVTPWVCLGPTYALKHVTESLHIECPGCPYGSTVSDILGNVEESVNRQRTS